MLHKSIALASAHFKLKADTNTFQGYASSFGNIDSVGDTIVKGAYTDTLKTNGLPKMFFNHDSYTVPLGKWVAAEEDDYGLLLTGEFTPGNPLADQVKAALQHGTLDSMSIGYALKAGDYESSPAGGYIIKKVALLKEVSIVTFPADKHARIDLSSVKNIDFETLLPECHTEQDIEQLLRDAGLGKWAATALILRAKSIFAAPHHQVDSEAKTLADLAKRLHTLAATCA